MNNKLAYNQILGYIDTDVLIPVDARSKPCGLSHAGLRVGITPGNVYLSFVNVVHCHTEVSA
jgi:hypothetical protein